MIIIFHLLIILIFVIGPVFIVFRLLRKSRKLRESLLQGLRVIDAEDLKKREIVAELESLLPELCSVTELEEVKQQVSVKEEEMRSEKGRIAIAEAEHEALETRLREMEEVGRELEASSVELDREIDGQKTQEKELKKAQEKTNKQLATALEQIDTLRGSAAESLVSDEGLIQSREILAQTQTRIAAHLESLATVNRQYIELKRAYDALDVEYAQLYEKQGEVEAAKAAPQS